MSQVTREPIVTSLIQIMYEIELLQSQARSENRLITSRDIEHLQWVVGLELHYSISSGPLLT